MKKRILFLIGVSIKRVCQRLVRPVSAMEDFAMELIETNCGCIYCRENKEDR